MPRTNGVYTPPAGTKAAPNTTIRSAPYNALVDDLTADANAARPITAGGTGATNATKARENLGAIASADILAAPLKDNPVDGDSLVLLDSEDDGKLKRTLWSKITSLLDGVYLKLTGGTLTGDIIIKRTGTKVLSFNRVDGSLVGNIYGAQDDATGVNIAVADNAGANQKFFTFGANGDFSAPGLVRGSGAVLTGSAQGAPVSGSRSAFSANGEGGAYASMWTRGAPYYAAVSFSGSSYAPLLAGRYGNPGWGGIWSAGVLNYTNGQAAGFTIHHLNSSGGENAAFEFRVDGSARFPGAVYKGGTSAVYADGGTWWINITGNSGYAASAGNAATLGGADRGYLESVSYNYGYSRTRDYLLAEHIPVGGYGFFQSTANILSGGTTAGTNLRWATGSGAPNAGGGGSPSYGTWQNCGPTVTGSSANRSADNATLWKRIG